MKAKRIAYWVTTGLVVFFLLPGGILQVTRQPMNVEGFTRLGYPIQFMVLLGVWKILGSIAILAPRFPRLKEWAYAGTFIDFTAAAVANTSAGEGAGHVIAPLVCTAFLIASWALRPESRMLGTILPAKS